jgi:aspartate/methionine/tyrosine aminotransferase
MGECGVRGGYAEILNMDPEVMAMLQKSISAKLCPPVLGQVEAKEERKRGGKREEETRKSKMVKHLYMPHACKHI